MTDLHVIVIALFQLVLGALIGWFVGRRDMLKDIDDELATALSQLKRVRTSCSICGMALETQCPKLCKETSQ